MKKLLISSITLFTLFASCSKLDNEVIIPNSNIGLTNVTGQSVSRPYYISEPLMFSSVDVLRDYANNQSAITKSTNGFVSYAETVMREPGYDDRPNAILSQKFGSILNANGEVIVNGYFAKLSDIGIIMGPLSEMDTIRKIANDNTIISRCNERTILKELNQYKEVYKIDGYESIFLYDLFYNLECTDMDDSSISPASTKTMAPNLVVYDRTLGSLNMLLDPYADFTVPPSGNQKVLLDNTHCNDTKIWQKEYFFIMDSGILVKTMEKGFLGIWSNIRNPIEGGVSKWVLEETGEFEDILGSTVDINKVNYDARNFLPRNVYTISARGSSFSYIMSRNLNQLLNEGNALSQSNNLSVYVEGVRFVVSDSMAYTRFPDRVDSDNWMTIDQDWPTPFWGDAYSNQSYLLNSQKLKNRVAFRALSATLYGQSTWNMITAGSKMIYHFN